MAYQTVKKIRAGELQAGDWIEVDVSDKLAEVISCVLHNGTVALSLMNEDCHVCRYPMAYQIVDAWRAGA